MNKLNGIHPRFEKCTLRAIRFDAEVGPFVEMTGEHGEHMIVSAEAAFVGPALLEIRKLAKVVPVREPTMEAKLRASVISLAERRAQR